MGKAASQLSVVFTPYRGTQLARPYTQVLPWTFASTASTGCRWETSSRVRVLTKRFVLLALWKPVAGLNILWVHSILGNFFFFFSHVQGSKTSVFIKDILFLRLEKITKKGRTNKSLQRRRRPTTCSPWAAILN